MFIKKVCKTHIVIDGQTVCRSQFVAHLAPKPAAAVDDNEGVVTMGLLRL